MKQIKRIIRKVLYILHKDDPHTEPLETYSHHGTLVNKQFK